jgi:hypothetical protein
VNGFEVRAAKMASGKMANTLLKQSAYSSRDEPLDFKRFLKKTDTSTMVRLTDFNLRTQ